jgi:thiol-disulfide isomerase/thioredoxin
MIFPALLFMLQTVVHTSQPAPQQEEQAQSDRAVDAKGKVYTEGRDANADVDAALTRAAGSGKTVIVIMGANWCHDSQDLAEWLAAPRFAAMMGPRYEIVYVDAGTPQTGDGNNQDIIKRFGGKKQKNTPYVMLLSGAGKLLNREDARTWRNASSRGEDAVYAYFAEFISA